MQPPIAEPPANGGQFAQSHPHRGIVRPSAAVTDRGPIGPQRRTRPPLADLKRNTKVSDGLAPGGGRHHFFVAISFSMALSSIASAEQLLQLGVLVFQRSQALGVRHIETAVPGFPFEKVALLIPCLRHTSAVFAPASCSRKIPMICSSVNQLGFMSIPSEVINSAHFGGSIGAQLSRYWPHPHRLSRKRTYEIVVRSR